MFYLYMYYILHCDKFNKFNKLKLKEGRKEGWD